MANTFVKIATVDVSAGGSSSIDFTSIPSTYTDLLVKWSLRSNSTSGNNEYNLLRFNNDSGSNYSLRSITGDASSASSGSRLNQTELWANNSSAGANNANDVGNTFSNGEIYLPNYLTSSQKSALIDVVVESNSTSNAKIGLGSGIWTGTSAINAIKMFPLSGIWVQHASATLYGIKSS